MPSKKALKILFWAARIWAVLAFLSLLFFIIHVINALNSDVPAFKDFSTAEFISFACLPIGVFLALVIAQFRHRLGGYLTVIFVICSRLFEGSMSYDLLIYGIPGLLFIIYSYLKSDKI